MLADRVIVTDVYPAGETPLPGVDGAAVLDALVRHGHPAAEYEPTLAAAAARVRAWVEPGDVVVTLGAGDVWKVGEELIREDRRQSSERKR